MLIETFGSSIAFTKNNYSEYEQTEFDMQWYLYDKNTILAHQHLPCRIIIDSLLNSSPTKIVVRVENQTFFPGYFANNGLIRAIGYGAEILEI
jgi:hypothetical protein